MKVVGLDGNTYSWPPTGHDLSKQREKCHSGLHHEVLEFLQSKFPTDTILQEIPLPGSQHPPLRIDFYLPGRRLAVEADGNQHSEFSVFFHGTMMEFRKAQHRDRQKQKWLEDNGIRLVRLAESNRNEWELLL